MDWISLKILARWGLDKLINYLQNIIFEYNFINESMGKPTGVIICH